MSSAQQLSTLCLYSAYHEYHMSTSMYHLYLIWDTNTVALLGMPRALALEVQWLMKKG